MPTLEDFLDLPIDDICGNGYVDHTSNHCAHFVSHALGFQFGTNCRGLTEGSNKAANIRVHELFGRCGKVGPWPPPAVAGPVLIFVTAADKVDLARKTMLNVLNKHVGVFSDGVIYHYSNPRGKVVRQGVAEFQALFDKAFGKPQGYFYGTPPGQPVVADTAAALAPITIATRRQGEDIYGKTDGEEFYVVTVTDALHGGLAQPEKRRYGPVFRASDWEDKIGHWANLLELTGHCECGNHFNAVHAHDPARIGFGFYQLPAHTPDDNLILLLRACTRLPAAARFLPELTLIDGALNVVESGGARALERVRKVGGQGLLVDLLKLINPTQSGRAKAELSYAARLVHWSNSDPELRALQVEIAAGVLERNVIERHDPRLDLDGRSDVEVALVADILHQGRATYEGVAAALERTDADALIDINPEPTYAVRQRLVRDKLRRMVKGKRLGRLRFSRAEGGFVDPEGPVA